MSVGIERTLDEESLGLKLEFVYEKSNRFSAAWKFLREANKINLDGMTERDKFFGLAITKATFPVAYVLAILSLKYSPHNLGYKF